MLFLYLECYAQDNKEKNSILFGETSFGYFTHDKSGSLTFSLSINYQYKKSLFTLRESFFSSTPFITDNYAPYDYREKRETSLFYGRRYIKNSFSYSFSFGISKTYSDQFNDIKKNFEDISYLGIPLEVNIRWFKANKKPFKLLGLLPIGKPTAFGLSNGVRLFSSISKNSYIGLGYTIGFGNYKKY